MKNLTILLGITLAASGSLYGESWQPFSSGIIQECQGETITVSTARVKVAKIGNVQGVKHNPPCGNPKEDVWSLTWNDQSGYGISVTPGSKAAYCKYISVSIPDDAKICEVRYYGSNSEGRGFKEVRDLRNKGKDRKWDWARKEPTETRVVDGMRVIRAKFKNWRRSYSRYFGIEIDIQAPISSLK